MVLTKENIMQDEFEDDESVENLNMDDISLYNLCAEDHRIFARVKDNSLIQIAIENEDGDIILREDTHLYAWESLVYFAKQVLYHDKRIQKDLDCKD